MLVWDYGLGLAVPNRPHGKFIMGKFFDYSTEEQAHETLDEIIDASYKLPFLMIKKLDYHLQNYMGVDTEKERHMVIKEMLPICFSAHNTILTVKTINNIDRTLMAQLEVTDAIKEEIHGINESLRALVLLKDTGNKDD